MKNIDARIFFQKKIENLIDSNFQNLRKVLPRNSFVEDHERVREDLAVAKHGLESSIDSNFQNLRKVLPRVHRRSRVDQGSTKIFPNSSKDVNMDWKVRSIPIFKIFERYYLEIHSLEVTRELEKIHRWQNLEFIDSRVDLSKSFQILRKMLTLNKTRIGKFDG